MLSQNYLQQQQDKVAIPNLWDLSLSFSPNHLSIYALACQKPRTGRKTYPIGCVVYISRMEETSRIL